MNISPAIIIDVALIAVIVVSVFHYARKGFVAGLMDLVGNLASLALASFRPRCLKTFSNRASLNRRPVPSSSRAG